MLEGEAVPTTRAYRRIDDHTYQFVSRVNGKVTTTSRVTMSADEQDAHDYDNRSRRGREAGEQHDLLGSAVDQPSQDVQRRLVPFDSVLPRTQSLCPRRQLPLPPRASRSVDPRRPHQPMPSLRHPPFSIFEITAQIGEGGMGQVFRATDTTLGRQVAIEILRRIRLRPRTHGAVRARGKDARVSEPSQHRSDYSFEKSGAYTPS